MKQNIYHQNSFWNIVLFAWICILFTPYQMNAQEDNWGAGIVIGQPTGISVKYWKNYSIAYDGAIAWSLGDNTQIQIYADYLFHKLDAIRINKERLSLYYGFGASINSGTEGGLGLRVPGGINYFFKQIPLDTFIELVPSFQMLPNTKLYVNIGIGLRYFFD